MYYKYFSFKSFLLTPPPLKNFWIRACNNCQLRIFIFHLERPIDFQIFQICLGNDRTRLLLNYTTQYPHYTFRMFWIRMHAWHLFSVPTIRSHAPVQMVPTRRVPDIRRFEPRVPTLFIIALQPMVRIIPKNYKRNNTSTYFEIIRPLK